MIGILWGQIYDPNFGLLNGLLEAVGLKQAQQIWLGDMKLALGCIIAVVVWQFIGNYILIYYTALHNISEDIAGVRQAGWCRGVGSCSATSNCL